MKTLNVKEIVHYSDNSVKVIANRVKSVLVKYLKNDIYAVVVRCKRAKKFSTPPDIQMSYNKGFETVVFPFTHETLFGIVLGYMKTNNIEEITIKDGKIELKSNK